MENIYFLIPARTPGNPQIRPGTAAPDPPNNVEPSQELVGFRSWGGGPVGNPQGVQVKTCIFNLKYLPKVSHVFIARKLRQIDARLQYFRTASQKYNVGMPPKPVALHADASIERRPQITVFFNINIYIIVYI